MFYYLGLRTNDARLLIRRASSRTLSSIRVVRRDGHAVVLTNDYRDTRLNVEETNGLISKVIGWF
jgi:hypothetical protein